MGRRGGFYDDDFDDDSPTRFDAGAPPNFGGGFPPPNFGGGGGFYDPAEAPTNFGPAGGGALPGGGSFSDAGDVTRMPSYASKNNFDNDSGHTLLGEEDIEVKPMGFLIVKRPLPQRGAVYKLGEVNTIGRAQGNIRLSADHRVSAIHARIRLGTDEEGEPIFVLKDMDSKTGTRVNDAKNRIDASHRLKPGDEIYIGDHVFVFMMLKD